MQRLLQHYLTESFSMAATGSAAEAIECIPNPGSRRIVINSGGTHSRGRSSNGLSVNDKPTLIVYWRQENLYSLPVRQFALENTGELREWAMLYDHEITKFKFLTDSHVPIFPDLGSQKSNYVFIHATRTGAERHDAVHSTRKTDFVDCLIDGNPGEQISWK
jgi:hypothetical protein